jgi:hypothetical protein
MIIISIKTLLILSIKFPPYMTMFWFWETLTKLLSLIDCGLYKPDINHFLLLIRISIMMDSIVLHSSLFFLSQAKSDRTYTINPPPCAFRSALQKCDNVFNLTGSSLSSTHDENNETYDIFNELTEQRKKHLSKVSIKSLLKLLSLIDWSL